MKFDGEKCAYLELGTQKYRQDSCTLWDSFGEILILLSCAFVHWLLKQHRLSVSFAANKIQRFLEQLKRVDREVTKGSEIISHNNKIRGRG